jgi:uncharacterized membrane protein
MPAAITLVLFGAATAALSLQLPLGTLRAPGSGFFPLVLGVLLMGLAGSHGIRLYLARPKPVAVPAAPTLPAAPTSDGATLRVVLFMGAVAFATAFLETLGYAIVSFLLMLALLWILGVRKWHVAGLIALGSAGFSQVVFVHWLRIPLPSGWLGL